MESWLSTPTTCRSWVRTLLEVHTQLSCPRSADTASKTLPNCTAGPTLRTTSTPNSNGARGRGPGSGASRRGRGQEACKHAVWQCAVLASGGKCADGMETAKRHVSMLSIAASYPGHIQRAYTVLCMLEHVKALSWYHCVFITRQLGHLCVRACVHARAVPVCCAYVHKCTSTLKVNAWAMLVWL